MHDGGLVVIFLYSTLFYFNKNRYTNEFVINAETALHSPLVKKFLKFKNNKTIHREKLPDYIIQQIISSKSIKSNSVLEKLAESNITCYIYHNELYFLKRDKTCIFKFLLEVMI